MVRMKDRGQALRKLPWLLLIPLGLFWPAILAGKSAWVERVYSQGVYPYIKYAIQSVTRHVRFSIAECILCALCLGIAIWLLSCIVRLLSKRLRLWGFLSALLSWCIVGGVLLNAFCLTWGFNYFRIPLKTRMGQDTSENSEEALYELTAWLAENAAALRDTAVIEDAQGVFTLQNGRDAVIDALPAAYGALSRREPIFAGTVSRAKSVMYSEGLSWAGISGIYIGLTAEPNINVSQPDLLLPHAAAHEMAHQLGIASEDEAEFAAFLACLCSEQADVRYAGLMQALIVCGNALYDVSPTRHKELVETYSDGMLRDLRNYNAYWARYEGPVEEAATQTNDHYLKHNAQPSGVESYGECVDLLLAYFHGRGASFFTAQTKS